MRNNISVASIADIAHVTHLRVNGLSAAFDSLCWYWHFITAGIKQRMRENNQNVALALLVPSSPRSLMASRRAIDAGRQRGGAMSSFVDQWRVAHEISCAAAASGGRPRFCWLGVTALLTEVSLWRDNARTHRRRKGYVLLDGENLRKGKLYDIWPEARIVVNQRHPSSMRGIFLLILARNALNVAANCAARHRDRHGLEHCCIE